MAADPEQLSLPIARDSDVFEFRSRAMMRMFSLAQASAAIFGDSNDVESFASNLGFPDLDRGAPIEAIGPDRSLFDPCLPRAPTVRVGYRRRMRA